MARDGVICGLRHRQSGRKSLLWQAAHVLAMYRVRRMDLRWPGDLLFFFLLALNISVKRRPGLLTVSRQLMLATTRHKVDLDI
jgi:hypothetical protein